MIYILEDDASIRKLVVYTLNSQGMEAEGFELPLPVLGAPWSGSSRPGAAGPHAPGGGRPARPQAHPRRRLRRQGSAVILITAKGTEYDKVAGTGRAGRTTTSPSPSA